MSEQVTNKYLSMKGLSQYDETVNKRLEKQRREARRFRNVTVVLMLTFIGILTIGILTRSPDNHINRSINLSEQSTANSQMLSELQSTLIQIQSQLNQIEAREIVIEAEVEGIKEEINSIQEEVHGGSELYNSYVDQIITEYYPNLPSDIVKAIIYLESRYHPDAVNSNTGVQGLMQVDPRWHTQRAENLGVEDLMDPYGNILVGCDILNEVSQQHDLNYAINFFAGGYKYADTYVNSTSPYQKELARCADEMREIGLL